MRFPGIFSRGAEKFGSAAGSHWTGSCGGLLRPIHSLDLEGWWSCTGFYERLAKMLELVCPGGACLQMVERTVFKRQANGVLPKVVGW